MESTSTTEIVSPTPSRCSTTPSSRSAGSWPGTRAAPAVATPATCGRGSPGAPRLASRSSVFAGPHRALRPVVDGGGTTPRLSHHRPTTVDGGRLLPLRRRRRLHRRLSGRARPSAEDRLRIDHPRARPHGAGRLPGQRCRRQPGRPRPRLPPRLLGLRVSEACSINIERLRTERRHRTVKVVGKGAKVAVIPLPPRVARAVDLAAGERTAGPVLLSRSGQRLDPTAPPASCAGSPARPGSPSRSRPTLCALDAGVPLRDVQIAARHADPVRQRAMTGPATTRIATPATSFPRSSRAGRHSAPRHVCAIRDGSATGVMGARSGLASLAS